MIRRGCTKRSAKRSASKRSRADTTTPKPRSRGNWPLGSKEPRGFSQTWKRNMRKAKDDFDLLINAHEHEARRRRAEIFNFGWATSDDGLCSKTSKGLLDTQRLRTGKIRHRWDPPIIFLE